MAKRPPDQLNINIASTAKGGGILTFGKVFAYGNRFILAFLLARLLGAEEFGLYSLALTISAIVSTVSLFGLDDAIMRFVAIYHAQKDEAKLWGALQFCLALTLILSIVLSAALYFLADSIAITIFDAPDLGRLIQLVSFIIPFLSMSEMLMFASQGFKKMHYTVIAEQLVQLPLRVVIVVLLINLGLDASLALIIFGVADFAASVLLVYFINKEFSLKRPLQAARWEVREIIAFAVPFWISDLLNTMRTHVQTIFLGSLSTIISVGIFTIVDRVNLVSKMAYSSITTSSRPVMAQLQAKEDWHQVGYLYTVSSRWGLTLSLPVFLVLVLFPGELLSLFGESFQQGAAALQVLAFAELVNTGTGLGGVIIDMTGQNRIKLFNSIAQVILSVASNVILIREYGLMGAAIASLLTVGIINILRMVEVFWLYRLVPYDGSYLKPAAATAAALAAAYVMSAVFPVEHFLVRLVVGIMVIGSVFIVVLIGLGLPNEEQVIINRATTVLRTASDRFRLKFSK